MATLNWKVPSLLLHRLWLKKPLQKPTKPLWRRQCCLHTAGDHRNSARMWDRAPRGANAPCIKLTRTPHGNYYYYYYYYSILHKLYYKT